MTRVALPMLQSEVERMQLILSYALVGALGLIASTSGPLVGVVLGPQCVPGASIFEVLCIGGVFQAHGYVYYRISYLVPGLVSYSFVKYLAEG